MFWQLFAAYPWGFIAKVILPAFAIVGSVIVCLDGYESLQLQFARDDKLNRIDVGVESIEDKLELWKSANEKLAAAGRRDAVLTALINQYQRLSEATATFGKMTRRDTSQDQGKIAATILDILNKDLVRTMIRADIPGQPLQIEVSPNSYRVIFDVPMRIVPKLTFTGLPNGVSASVTDASEISFTVTFFPLSVPVTSFGFTADAEF